MNKYWGGTAEGNQYNFGVKNLSYTLCLHASEAAHTSRKLRIMLDDKAPIKWYFGNSRVQPSPARSGRLGHEPDQSFFPWCYTLKNSYQLGMIRTEVLWGKPLSRGTMLAQVWLRITKVRKPQKDLPSQQAVYLFVPLEAGEPVAFCYRNREFLLRRSRCRAWECLLLCGHRNPSRLEASGAQETEPLQVCHPPAFSQVHQYPSGSIKNDTRIVKDSDIFLSSDLRVIFPIDQVPF